MLLVQKRRNGERIKNNLVIIADAIHRVTAEADEVDEIGFLCCMSVASFHFFVMLGKQQFIQSLLL